MQSGSALEIFGEEAKARSWMQTPRDLFDGRAPEELVQSGDPAVQRRVLEVLIRIDYGSFPKTYTQFGLLRAITGTDAPGSGSTVAIQCPKL